MHVYFSPSQHVHTLEDSTLIYNKCMSVNELEKCNNNNHHLFSISRQNWIRVNIFVMINTRSTFYSLCQEWMERWGCSATSK